MTVITIGTDSTFKSTTAEALLVEICTFLQNKELNTLSNPTSKDYVQISYNLNDMTTGISFSIPAEQSIDATGQVLTTAIEYLQGVTFASGDGGTIKSTTLSQYFLEVVTFLQIKENNSTTNPQSINNISSTYDADEKLFSGSINLPITVNFDDAGHPMIIATEYLL